MDPDPSNKLFWIRSESDQQNWILSILVREQCIPGSLGDGLGHVMLGIVGVEALEAPVPVHAQIVPDKLGYLTTKNLASYARRTGMSLIPEHSMVGQFLY